MRTVDTGSCSDSVKSLGVLRNVMGTQSSVSDTFKKTGPDAGSIERVEDGNHLLDRLTP